jgi:catalase
MPDTYTPREYVDAIAADFPDHEPDTRPVHVNGIGVRGYFRASGPAADWCTAEMFRGQDVPVTVRFSNGSGNFPRQDQLNDVRGMATRFHLGDDRCADLIAMTLGEFFTSDEDTFMAFTRASVPEPARAESPWRKLLDMLQLKMPLPDPPAAQRYDTSAGALAYANRHAFARQAVADTSALGAPASYARAAYHAVNTFIAVAPDGHRHHVRFSWQPVAGLRRASPEQLQQPDYLNAELRRRIAHWPPRFVLNMVLGDTGDALNDPTIPWPRRRRKISMGMLYLTDVPEDQETYARRISFNPGRLTPGLEASEQDRILQLRIKVYETSREMRGGQACPFHTASQGEEQTDGQ